MNLVDSIDSLKVKVPQNYKVFVRFLIADTQLN